MRGPNGERFVRRFWKSKTTIQNLVNFYKKQINQNVVVRLVVTFPKKNLADMNMTLE